MNKKKLIGIIVACVVVVVVVIVLVHFQPWERTCMLSISIDPPQAGSVSPLGGEYECGEQITLTATSARGYIFDYWSGSVSGTTSTISITMDSDESLTAHFETIPEIPEVSEVLFSDDFSDEGGVWNTFSDEEGSVFYSNGWLHLYTSGRFSTSTCAHQYFADFILEVETRLVEGTHNNWHQVACRLINEGNSYEFAISADGYYAVAKYVDGYRMYFVAPTYSSCINQGVSAVNLIHIECIGSTLSLSVNEHLLWEGTDTSFTSGDIGLGARSLKAVSTEIAFDNIVVRESVS